MSARTLITRQWRVVRPLPLLATRTFITTLPHHKTATDTVKDAAKAVDRTVSQAAIKGLEGVEKVNEVAKDAAEKVGINVNKEDPLDELEVEGKAAATKAHVKGEQVKRDAKAGVRHAADKIKDAAK
jgi:hypothetical protein